MQSNSRKLQKIPVLVEIILSDDSKIHGRLFLSPQERLIDALNDNRSFLPIETMDGSVLALAKTGIKHVVLPAAFAAPYRGGDPYLILGVKEGVSKEKLKSVYHQACKDSHPDRIKGFGLGEEFQELASRKMMLINEAYSQILKTLKNADSERHGANSDPDQMRQPSL